MSGWEVGDLALCINAGGWENDQSLISGDAADEHGPSCGSIHSVARVVQGPFLALSLDGWTHLNTFFEAECFVKVTPPAADEFDREIIEAMNGEPVTV